MTSQEAVNLKEGDIVYVVPEAAFSMYNPFLRHQGQTNVRYWKPFGVFKTTVSKINERHCTGGSYYINGEFDITPFAHLIWKGRWDELPEGKSATDYDSSHADRFDATYKNCFGDHTIDNAFLTKEEATKYYGKTLKNWKRNMKNFLARLENEIIEANNNINECQRQIQKFSVFVE